MPCPEFPRIADCPLYVLSHDARFAGFGCVDDIAQPCKAARGKVSFAKLFDRAHAELFRRVRAHYLKDER